MVWLADYPDPPQGSDLDLALDRIGDSEIGREAFDLGVFDTVNLTEIMDSQDLIRASIFVLTSPNQPAYWRLGTLLEVARPEEYNRIRLSLAERMVER